ncbi:hypothetical protein [Heyndrickxia camelliae]|uniref:Uncharacterized protein n=1 Tax=Heyndrickxia camelliae TaxID=1707093 RepID=A0A2N3LEN1_9BACI|nr:hypothetical protein [Heyndrickxia camelliae]PKR83045.1 hypothetical protein CWO92_21140 [Heyndrickxia camelliae]
MKFKVFLFTLLFIFLWYMSIFTAGFLPFIAKHKKDFSLEVLNQYILDILLHPFKNIIEMISVANPLVYICMGAAFFIFIYILIKTRGKNYETVGEKYGVQGSSRWAKKAEIFKVPEQITIVPSIDMYAELKKTLKNNSNSEYINEVK